MSKNLHKNQIDQPLKACFTALALWASVGILPIRALAQEKPEEDYPPPQAAQIVWEFAEHYVASLSEEDLQRQYIKSRALAVREFVSFFRASYVTAGSYSFWPRDPKRPWNLMDEADAAGKNYYWGRPDKRKEVMNGFGYREVTMDGVYSAGFEVSRFWPVVPFMKIDRPNNSCWLQYMPDGESELRSKWKGPVSYVPITVTGYLNSAGSFGHMGMYACEVLAQTLVIREVNP